MDCVATALIKCTDFAARKHSTQRRKDPEETPYINHPIGVAAILVEAGETDPCVLQAALLHDTVEDTDTSPQELRECFGEAVAAVVAEVTDDKTLSAAERKARQVTKAATCSRQAKLVKLADKIYNCSDLVRVLPVGWTETRRQEYLAWTRRVLEGGLRGVNPTLEGRLEKILLEHSK